MIDWLIDWLQDWKEDLKLGGSIIWGSLGVGNILTVIICIVYLIQKVNWGHAAKKSTMAMERIEKISSSRSMTPIDSKGNELEKQLLGNL